MIECLSGAIDYEETGTGATIVLVPGSCSTGAAWRPVVAHWNGHELFRQGWTVVDMQRRRVDKWVRLEVLPARFQCDPKPTSPRYFHAPLQALMR
jgi:hypothetical protein